MKTLCIHLLKKCYVVTEKDGVNMIDILEHTRKHEQARAVLRRCAKGHLEALALSNVHNRGPSRPFNHYDCVRASGRASKAEHHHRLKAKVK